MGNRRKLGLAGRISLLTGWSYIGIMAIWLLGRLIAFDQVWWFAFIDYLALYLFLPLLILMPLALTLRRRALALALLAPLGGFLWLYGQLFLPAPPAPAAGPQLRVMSINKLWDNTATDRIAAAIDQARPDIVGLQEVVPADMAALRAALAQRYPYSAYRTVPAEGAVHDSALFSRFPLEDVRFSEQSSQPDITARIAVDGQPLTVIVTHLARNNLLNFPRDQLATYAADLLKLRTAEVGELRRRMADRAEPLLILCDCNLSRTNRLYDELAGSARDSFAEAGWGLGNTARLGPIPLPLLRIDYIWHSAELAAREAYVGPEVGSDHLPVVATLQIVR